MNTARLGVRVIAERYEVRNNLVSSRIRGFLGVSAACFTAHTYN